LLRELSRRHRVVVATTDSPTEDVRGLDDFLRDCEDRQSIPFAAPKRGSAAFLGTLARSWTSPLPVDLWKWRCRAMQRQLERILATSDFDVVVGDFMAALANIPPRRAALVYFAHNVEHLIWKRLADVETRWWRRQLLEVEWRKMRRAEVRACRDAALTVAVSEDDGRRLIEGAPGSRVATMPTGVDVDYFQPAPAADVPGRLVFSGSMDWYPNEDAILHFVQATLPLIRRERPDATLTVIGRNPSDRLRAAADAAGGVSVTGTVADVRPHIAAGAVYVVPLRVGGGTRLKIFEALAMAKPVVSTTIGAEGLDVEPGRHAVLADDPEAFSREVIRLLDDVDGRARMGAAGRALVEARYSWSEVARVFEAHLMDAIASHDVQPAAASRRLATS
jgi:glycosyltransferase involved in cell wall biosynthesis